MTDSLKPRVVAAIGEMYEIDGEIGRGGMAVVYRARDLRLNRAVAIKVLPPDLAFDPAIRTRFTREAQTSAQLAHGHIVPIYDVGQRAGIAYFVMAYVSGGNLATALAREPRQPISEVRRIACEIADALAYAHMHGVVHRDVKPDNILLDASNGRAMVTDFGIARAMEAGSRLTASGIAVGTPAYMSPEQAMGEREIDGRADIYALGVLTYQMLAGRVPFTGGNTMALLLKHVSERPRPITELRPDAPRDLCAAVERALSKDPEDRWPTAASFRDAIGSEKGTALAWRSEVREPVRYTSPIPERRVARERPRDKQRADQLDARQVIRPDGIVMETEHLARLAPDERRDLRLWHGRVNLLDRIKAARGYLWFTVAMAFGSIFGIVGAVEGEIPPLALAPLIPMYMTRKLWLRGKSLRASGLKLRRVFLMPRAKWVLPPPPPPPPSQQQLEKLAPRELIESPYGAAIRRAAEDRDSIQEIVRSLPKADRALIPDVEPTVKSLLERVVHLARRLYTLEQGLDLGMIAELDQRIAQVEAEADSGERERRLSLLRRQRDTLSDLMSRRDTLARQLDNANLALGNLRLDLVKLRSSGVEAALADISTATQEARALSHEIGAVLDAAAAVKSL